MYVGGTQEAKVGNFGVLGLRPVVSHVWSYVSKAASGIRISTGGS